MEIDYPKEHKEKLIEGLKNANSFFGGLFKKKRLAVLYDRDEYDMIEFNSRYKAGKALWDHWDSYSVEKIKEELKYR